MRRPIQRIQAGYVPQSLGEQDVRAAVTQAVLDRLPEVENDPLFEVEARDRGGYYAAFVFVADGNLMQRLESLAFEIGERAEDYGAKVLIYPRTWTP